LPPGSRVVSSKSDARGLLDVANEEGCDLIVVGSTHRGVAGRILIGSVGERLLHGSSCAVAVAPKHFSDRVDGLHVIAAAFDGSAESRAALVAAADLALAAHATLRVIAVAVPKQTYGGAASVGVSATALQASVRERLEEDLRQTLDLLPRSIRAAGTVHGGSPATTIAEECEKGVDLLFLGSRGRGPLRTVLLGSVAAELMQTAPCPVIVVPTASAGDAPPARHRKEATA
jgi:nucleotide-binding universal stress UspA family protein